MYIHTLTLEQNKAFVDLYLRFAPEMNLSLAGTEDNDKSFNFTTLVKLMGLCFSEIYWKQDYKYKPWKSWV